MLFCQIYLNATQLVQLPTITMKSLSLFILACTASVSVSASIWGFGDASVTIQSKKGGSKDASKDE